MAEVEIEVGKPTRQARTMAVQRTMTDDDETTSIEVQTDGIIAPEDALAQAQKIIEQRDADLVAANRRVADESAARSRAEREAQRANQGRATDRQIAIGAAVESATSEKTAAIAALRAARESGDLEAEIKAQEQLSTATYRLASASAELEALKTSGGDPTSAAGNVRDQGQSGGPGPATQAWIDRHPRFNSDKGYKDAMLKAHADAVNSGIVPESPAYFKYLDETASVLEGGNGGGQQTMEHGNGNGNQQRPRFNGAPPSRSGGGQGAGGGKTIQTALGPVTVYTKADGSKRVSVPPHLKADFEEGAKVCGMDLGEYILDMAESGDQGLITADGSVYR